MRRERFRWLAAVTLTALVSLSTLGLYHVYAHADDAHSKECATCRVVTSSTTLVSATAHVCTPVITEQATADLADDPAVQQICACPGSRGPPAVS